MLYQAYTAKHGPLSVARMHDRPAALVAHVLASCNGGRDLKLADFMPRFHAPEQEDS